MITWATPAAITYGTALSATQLDANSGGVRARSSTTRWQEALRQRARTRSRSPSRERHDGLHDRNADGFVDGEQGTPLITWATPAAITYGTALSATQLDASSGGVAGAFVYNPLAGSTPATGTDTLSVTFTPSDTTDYTTATQTVS